MAYEMPTKRIEFEGGGYAVLCLQLKHGTQKAVNAILRPLMKTPDGGTVATLSVQEGDGKTKVEGPTEVQIELAQVDFTAVNDIILLKQVNEWSFGPVDQATLDVVPEPIIERLVEEANGLYGEVPLAKGGGGN